MTGRVPLTLTSREKDAIELYKTTGCIGVLNSAGLRVSGGVIVRSIKEGQREEEPMKKHNKH